MALGAVVMNWGKDYVVTTAKDVSEKSNLDLSCQQDIELDVKEIGNVPKICYNNGSSIEVMLENNGRTGITGMQIILFDSNDNLEIIKNESLAIAAGAVSNKLNISYNQTTLTGSIAQAEFIPMIKPKGATSSKLCSKNSLVVDDITTCS